MKVGSKSRRLWLQLESQARCDMHPSILQHKPEPFIHHCASNLISMLLVVLVHWFYELKAQLPQIHRRFVTNVSNCHKWLVGNALVCPLNSHMTGKLSHIYLFHQPVPLSQPLVWMLGGELSVHNCHNTGLCEKQTRLHASSFLFPQTHVYRHINMFMRGQR